MMKTTIKSSTPRLFEVGRDDEKPEHIEARDCIEAFTRWWRLERGDPTNLQIEIGGGLISLQIWVGYELFKVRDITIET